MCQSLSQRLAKQLLKALPIVGIAIFAFVWQVHECSGAKVVPDKKVEQKDNEFPNVEQLKLVAQIPASVSGLAFDGEKLWVSIYQI